MSPDRVHPAAADPDVLLGHCRISFGRASGPGGQHRNKVETAVVLTHQPTGLTGSAGERRSQQDNRRMALFRLRLNLALCARGYFALRTVPSALWRTRCSPTGRVAVNPQHPDFPGLLAEALDVLAALKWDPGKAADLLGCTTSQFIKFLKDEPRALALVNQQRLTRHLHALK